MTEQAFAEVLSKPRTSRRVVAGVRYATAMLLFAIGYFACAQLGFRAAVAHHVVSSAWPPAGMALALLILLGLRWWPSIALGAFLANFVSGIPAGASVAIAGGNTVEAIVGALLLVRFAAFEPALRRLRDVVALAVLGAGVSTLVSATVGVASLELAGAAHGGAAGTLWPVWWTGDAIGVLMVTPLVLTWWSDPRWRGSTREAAIAALLLTSLVALTSLLFRIPYAFAYAVFPLVLAISWRYGPRGAATATTVVGIIAVTQTLSGLGPFAVGNPMSNLFRFQIFLALLAYTALGFAALTAERQRATEELRESRQELRALAARLVELREQERTVIARDVHDQLAQTLTALLFDLDVVARRLPHDDATLTAKVRHMKTLIEGTSANVQRIVAELRPAVLDDLGLVAAVEWQTDEWHAHTGIAVALDLPTGELDLAREDATLAFRILQEALTNVARHAHATRVDVSLVDADTKLVLEIRDNGHGISPENLTSPRSVGLIGMRERALERGGEVIITGVRGQGTTVRLGIPLASKPSSRVSA